MIFHRGRFSLTLILTAALAATLAACSGLPRQSAAERLALYRANAGEPVSSFLLLGSGVDGWTDLGTDAVAVWPRANEVYLLELNGPCLDLDFADAISVTSSGSRVYAGFDDVRVLGGGTGSIRLPCRINTIRPVNVAAIKEADKARRAASSVERQQQTQAKP
jgi:hypothetical protein